MEVLHNYHSLIENYCHCHIHQISNQKLLERPPYNLLLGNHDNVTIKILGDHDNVTMKMKKQNMRDLTVVEDNILKVVDDIVVEVDNNEEVVVDSYT